MNSLRARLGIRLVLSLIIVFGLQWLAVSYSIRQVTYSYVSSRIEHDVESLLAAVEFTSEGRMQLPAEVLTAIYHTPYSGHYYVLQNSQHSLLSRSLWDQELLIEDLPLGQTATYTREGPLEQSLLILQQAFRKQGQMIQVAVAEDTSVVDEDIHAFQMQYLGLSLLCMALLLGLQLLGIGKALRPLDKSRAEIESLIQGRINKVDDDVPVEIQPLMREVNRLLALLERRLTQSRSAIGNLAHALKTPLTVLQQLNQPQHLSGDDMQQLAAQVDSMQRLLDRELRLARLAGGGPAGTAFQPEEDLGGLILVLNRIYPDIEVKLQVRSAAQEGRLFDREDMLECLGNLLDNACKWAKKTVSVQVDASHGLSICIADDGPGCSQAQLQLLGTRGIRLDENIAGHGLGLSICREVVEHYQGHLEFGQSAELKGLEVRLILPLDQGLS